FQVAVSPKAPRVGEPIRIELTARTPADYAVAFPADDALTAATGFEIVAAELPQSQALPDGGLEWSRTITAEAYLSGEVEIPALALRYGRRAGGPGSPPDGAGGPGSPPDGAGGAGSPSDRAG